MSDTRVLLTKIAALRQRLEQAPAGPDSAPERVRRLEGAVALSADFGNLLDGSIRQLSDPTNIEPAPLPTRLTARARRLLEVGRGLLAQLRNLADFFSAAPDGDPLAARFKQTLAIADTSLRTVQTYPDSPSVQLRLCEGLEGILGVVAERVGALHIAVAQRRQVTNRVHTLTDLLLGVHAGSAGDLNALVRLAEGLLADAKEALPPHFYLTERHELPALDGKAAGRAVAEIVACHSLTVAQVMARLVRHDVEFRGQAVEAVLAGLVHDAGMLRISATIYAQAGGLDEFQRREVEEHTRGGAELIARVLPDGKWLTETVACHHERLDGTGYPCGLRGGQIPPLARLLAVCDVYSALCAARPHRPAREPRTALTDTLLLAEKGVLDRACAEGLLQLSFYPPGSVVELADGALGLVVAAHVNPSNLDAPARPVVALLTTGQGQPLPMPRYIDLVECEGRSVVRALPPSERRQLLGKHHPELAA